MSADPKVYNELFTEISKEASELEDKFASGNFTSRDLALLGELWSRYVDGLDSLANEGIKITPTEYITKINGKTIKFQDDKSMAGFISALMGDKNAAI